MASFKKHDTGWEYRIRVKDPYMQKFKEKSQRGFATKKEAQLAAAEAEKQFKSGHEQADMPLREYLDLWLTEYKTGTVKKGTIGVHRYNIDQHIKPHFKNIRLREVKPIMYQAFLNTIGEKGYSRQTIVMVNSTMHNAMKKAVQLGKLEKNPCDGAEIKGRQEKREVKFIDSTDVPTFLSAAKQEYRYWITFKLLMFTGMRKGEAAALQWSDIDLDAGTININKTLDFNTTDDGAEERFGGPKTISSIRTIRIVGPLLADLRNHREWQERNDARSDLNLVLSREDGRPLSKVTLFRAFRRALKRAGLPPLPIHSLRHTCAVLLLEAGVDMKFIQEQLGHGSIQVTSDVYSHISKRIEQTAVEKFEAFTNRFL